MNVNVKCPSCGELQRLSDDQLGQKLRCPACGAGFRVAAPKSAAPSEPAAPKAAQPRPVLTAPEPYALRAQDEPAAARESRPKPPRPEPVESPRRGGPPPWLYAVGGGGAVGIVVAVVVAIRALGGAGSGAGTFPVPSTTIAQGVASPEGPVPAPAVAQSRPAQPAVTQPPRPPAQSPVATAAAPGNLAVRNPSPAAVAPVANNPPPAMLAAGTTAPPPATAPAATSATPPTTTSPTPSAKGAPLTTAQIVAKCEPSVALVKGISSSGTGFLVAPGIVATNSHVIDEEFVSSLEVRFPSAPEGKQGPLPAELLYEDTKRDLAFLKVTTDLPPIEVAPSYSFTKGEDVTVIGNPGLGGDVVLENAISRGVMSSKATLDGLNFFQMNIAVNPGNSGGPVFDSSGRAIGVVTLKSNKTEAMAFCIPVEELQTAMAKLGTAHPDMVSNHRARVAFQLLTAAGAIRAVGLEIRAGLMRQAPQGGKVNLLPNEPIQKLHETINAIDDKVYTLIEGEVAQMKSDGALGAGMRGRCQDLWASYKSMKTLYGTTNRPAAQYTSQVRDLRAKYIRLVEAMQKDLKMDVPAQLMTLLKTSFVDGQQAQTVYAQVVPAPMQSRMLRGPSRVIQRPGAATRPGQSARDRMQDARDRMRSRGRR